MLGNWAETPFFLQLQHEKNPDDADMSKTVFQDKIEELIYFKRDIIAKIVESIFYAVKARSLKYRTEVKEAMTGSLKVVACISIAVSVRLTTFLQYLTIQRQHYCASHLPLHNRKLLACNWSKMLSGSSSRLGACVYL